MTATWLDDDTVAYYAAEEEQIYLVSLSSGARVAFPGGKISHYNVHSERMLFSSQGSERFPLKAVYAVDRMGQIDLLARVDQLEAFCPLGAEGEVLYTPDTWMLTHPYWSPNGRTISFVSRIRAGLAYTWLMDPEGDNLRPWSRTTPRPMHYYWWDDGSMYGHDHAQVGDRYMRRWNMEGQVIETVSGPGCHGTVSPDKQWIVTEDWYGTDPTQLYLYRRGETTPTTVLAVQKAHWRRSDMHPAFSFDGQRVYFNYNVPKDNTARLYCCDLSALKEGS
jgi:Tol biopolymer transport system component